MRELLARGSEETFMTCIPTPRSTSLFLAGIVSLLASACGTSDLLRNHVESPEGKYEAQDCVENALRNQPDPEAVREAALAFTTACRGGEAASCSVLGVMYELGRGVPLSASRALALYERACDAHNPRACGNLGDLLLSDRAGVRDPARAVFLLRSACDAEQGRACERLGRAYRDGDGEPQDAGRAAALFDAACSDGYAPACAAVADPIALSPERDLRRASNPS
jgi:TPR repeat protein